MRPLTSALVAAVAAAGPGLHVVATTEPPMAPASAWQVVDEQPYSARRLPGRRGDWLATIDLASGVVTPIELETPLEPVFSLQWVDGAVLVRMRPSTGVVLTLQPD